MAVLEVAARAEEHLAGIALRSQANAAAALKAVRVEWFGSRRFGELVVLGASCWTVGFLERCCALARPAIEERLVTATDVGEAYDELVTLGIEGPLVADDAHLTYAGQVALGHWQREARQILLDAGARLWSDRPLREVLDELDDRFGRLALEVPLPAVAA